MVIFYRFMPGEDLRKRVYDLNRLDHLTVVHIFALKHMTFSFQRCGHDQRVIIRKRHVLSQGGCP